MSKFNVNAPLFGYLSGTVEDLTLASSSISGGSAALCNNASGAHLKNVAAHDIRLRPDNLNKPAGILAGEAESTVFEDCRVADSSVINTGASWLGGAVGKMYSGSVDGLTLSGEITVQGRRAVGGVIGQILSNKEVSLSRIRMEGTADISQAQANHGSGENRGFYNAAGLIAGLCEVNYPVSLEGIELHGIPAGAGETGGRGRTFKGEERQQMPLLCGRVPGGFPLQIRRIQRQYPDSRRGDRGKRPPADR